MSNYSYKALDADGEGDSDGGGEAFGDGCHGYRGGKKECFNKCFSLQKVSDGKERT